MINKLCWLLICIPLFVSAQESSGIKWTSGLNWDQVKAKAKAENKYIFIDVYATWCGPCKIMDKEIYPLPTVGKLYNDKFISIRVQADRSEKEDSEIRNWHEDAENICIQYRVGAYPTFLFITPDGKLLHRASGGLNEENFLNLAKDALQQKGYAALVEKFQEGKYENLNFKELAMAAKYAGDDSLAKAIGTTYIRNIDFPELIKQENMQFVFLLAGNDAKWTKEVCMPKLKRLSIFELANPQAIRFLFYAAKNDSLAITATNLWVLKMPSNEFPSKETLEYLKSFMRHTNDESFRLLYLNTKHFDEIMGVKNWAQGDLDNVIIKDEFFEPVYKPVAKQIEAGDNASSISDPDWKKLERTIRKKYGASCAERLRFVPKISWYNLVQNKKEYVKNIVLEMERTRGWNLNGLTLNNNSMEIFMYSTKRKDLEKAATLMKRYFEKNPKEMGTDATGVDTYATLLYKAGRIQEGITLEKKAALIDPANSEIARNLSKMQKGLPIWPAGYDVVD